MTMLASSNICIHSLYLCIREKLMSDGFNSLRAYSREAIILIAAFFGLNALLYLVFHTDMRLFFVSARVMLTWESILAGLMYIPFFLIFYISNSLRVNCSMRPSNWSEWLSKVISFLGNTLGLVAILVIEYLPFIRTGTIGYTDTAAPQWLFVNMLFSIIPLMAALPLLNRFFFNKSGRAWVGPIVICVIFIMMTTSGTTIYYMIGEGEPAMKKIVCFILCALLLATSLVSCKKEEETEGVKLISGESLAARSSSLEWR